ncbi:C25 family cysteine peptidase [Rubritalea tangerina]|uniref:C25 family cysteine peptidase n=2 Tax=Rubritalea tangerina TaxID=430798 RepID=A0ABW4ZA86_9BACT
MNRFLKFGVVASTLCVAQGHVMAKGADILLVTSPELEASWSAYVKWKGEVMGKPTKVMTTAQIEEAYDGVDLQEKIRVCVREHIDKMGTQWVVLGGDSEPNGGGVVPDRDTVHETRWGKNSDIATDIYYLSATSWDADGDGIYGEFKDDKEAISYPDGSVGIGRIPVRTAEEVKAYTEKVVAYESVYPKDGFRDRIVFTCTVPSAYAKVVRSWDDHISNALPAEARYQYFLDAKHWDEEAGKYALIPKNWVSMFNAKRYGKVHLHGHGLHGCWVLDGHKQFTKDHVEQLGNKGAYPVITTVSCFTGHFDSAEDPCISESMLRAPSAGAIAIVAPCREGKPHFMNPKIDFPLMVKEGKMDGTTSTMAFFWELGIGGKLSTGEALMKSKASMSEKAKQSAMYHMCLSEINLLGDPTIAVHPKLSDQ